MSKRPGLFVDIGKQATDLLTRDYKTDHRVSISNNSACGMAPTPTALKNGVVYAYYVAQDKNRNILNTFTFTEILPSPKAIASFQVPDYNSSKVEAQYFCNM